MPEQHPRCEHCRFWVLQAKYETAKPPTCLGACKRYPHVEEKWSEDFCGEFRRAKQLPAKEHR